MTPHEQMEGVMQEQGLAGEKLWCLPWSRCGALAPLEPEG